jgi:hypothetical protein
MLGGRGTDHAKSMTLNEKSIMDGLKIGLAFDFRADFFVLRHFLGHGLRRRRPEAWPGGQLGVTSIVAIAIPALRVVPFRRWISA